MLAALQNVGMVSHIDAFQHENHVFGDVGSPQSCNRADGIHRPPETIWNE